MKVWVMLSRVKHGLKTMDLKIPKVFPGVFYSLYNLLFPGFKWAFKGWDRGIREFIYPMICW